MNTSTPTSVSQYVREAALIRAVLDELDSEDALRTATSSQSPARSALAQIDPPGPPHRADSMQRFVDVGRRRRDVDVGAAPLVFQVVAAEGVGGGALTE